VSVLSALAVGVEMISKATSGKTGNKLKFTRRIIIVTDGQGYMDTADLDAIAGKIQEEEIEITLLGVDFDDPDSGYKEEEKDSVKEENETVLREFIEACKGNFGTLAEAIDQLDIPRIKTTRAVPSYRGTLTLGDTVNYDTAMTIDIERYPCTMIARPPTASSFAVKKELGDLVGPSEQSSHTVMGDDQQANGELSAVRNQRLYQVDNPDEPGAKKNVDIEDLERGFEYGRTAVHISESDANIVKLETTASLDLIGFVAEEKVIHI
jgi:ATP-dependent DNA helicase 2 subunit 2